MTPWIETARPSPGHFGWWLRKGSWRDRSPGGCRLLEADFPSVCLCVFPTPCPEKTHTALNPIVSITVAHSHWPAANAMSVSTPPTSQCFLSSPLSAVYLPAKLEKGFPLPLPRDTYLNGLELQIHKVSEKRGLVGSSKNAWEGCFRVDGY